MLPTATQTGPSGTGTTGAATTTSEPKKSNAGAIAGGVVGGVVFLALVGLAIFFFLRRRKARQTPPSAAYAAAPLSSPSSPPPMSYGDGTSTYATIPTPKIYVRFSHVMEEFLLNLLLLNRTPKTPLPSRAIRARCHILLLRTMVRLLTMANPTTATTSVSKTLIISHRRSLVNRQRLAIPKPIPLSPPKLSPLRVTRVPLNSKLAVVQLECSPYCLLPCPSRVYLTTLKLL